MPIQAISLTLLLLKSPRYNSRIIMTVSLVIGLLFFLQGVSGLLR